MARSLDDIKKSYGPRDCEAEIRAALKNISVGKYETSVELFNRAGISTKMIPEVQPKFEAYTVLVKNAARKPAWLWARTPADAKKLRDALKSQNG